MNSAPKPSPPAPFSAHPHRSRRSLSAFPPARHIRQTPGTGQSRFPAPGARRERPQAQRRVPRIMRVAARVAWLLVLAAPAAVSAESAPDPRTEAYLRAETERQVDAAQPDRRFRDCRECPWLVAAPAGWYLMGAPENEAGSYGNERPRHRVTIAAPFAVGVHEVTFAQWEACVDGGGCNGYRPDDEGWGRATLPVINVSWLDAQEYVRWLSRRTGQPYRLLSESEWEYAARGGTTGPFHFGETISPTQANYKGTRTYGAGRTGRYRQRPLAVGSFPANAFGLHDVHGNVWEWVQDCHHDGYAGAPANGSAWETGQCDRRVARGGSWNLAPKYLRSAYRISESSGYRHNYVGFRVARTLAE